MKNLFTLSILLLAGMAYSQCPPGSVTLTSQAEIDDFVANYPGCQVIDGNLTIGNDVLVAETPLDVSGLSALTEVTGTLSIGRMHIFDEELGEIVPASLTGLEGITDVKSLLVRSMIAPVYFESLDPLNTIAGQVDSLFLENLILSNPLPPFENVEGIGYYRHDYVRGIESTPAFPALTYMGDMTIMGLTIADDTLETVIIPPLLTEISTNPDSFNWPFGGIFVFGTGGVTEIVGGESLTYIQAGSFSNNLNLSDISAFDNVTDVGINGLSISSCQPEIFDSFGKLETVEADFPVEFEFALAEDCNEIIFESVDFGISSELANGAETSYELMITADQVNSISVSGNFTNLKSLDLNSFLASEITGFSSLDSITGDLSIDARGISQLPTFSDLVYIGGNFDMRLNFGDWQLENMLGLESLEVVAGEFTMGGFGPSGAALFQSLDGLEGLTNVGALELRNLEALNDLSALTGLESLEELSLRNLDALTTPPSFDSLEEFDLIRIDDTALPSMPLFPSTVSIEGDIFVNNNTVLTTLNGFENLETLNGIITVESNESLASIDLPTDLEFAGELTLIQNASLEDCGMSASICNIVGQASVFTIAENGNECTLSSEVLGTCLLGIEDGQAPNSVSIAAMSEGILIKSAKQLNDVRLELYSLEGKRLMAEQRDISPGEQLLPLPKLSEGIYLISLQSADLAFSQKIFIRAW